MEGITTAIVAFIFVCIVYPHMVKNRAQFYTAFLMVVLMLFFYTLAGIIQSIGFHRFVMGLNGFLQLGALVLLVLATGGLSLGQLTGEFKNAIEVIRRGETEKEIIIPRSGQTPMARDEEPARNVYTINTEEYKPGDRPGAPQA